MLKAYDAHPAGAPDSVSWSVRVLLTPGPGALAVARLREHTLRVHAPVSFKPSGDPAPSSLETLLAALGTEVATGFHTRARRSGKIVDALEASVAASLENPLVAAGVVGEEGSPALARVALTLYVASPEDEADLRDLLDRTLAAGPVHATLARACPVAVTLRLVH